ncbi:hypothetical protein [Bacillus suaedae]|uniref:DUF4085 family protein n=1 Tax=Halalkalibacter suaedae TaxID=2822140 RepID=A0A941AQZ7_9BACI|nr:hypothetical protein [Bacillus suaedae]MBP3951823.1 hypothetical protein [Bacillus suaedae]
MKYFTYDLLTALSNESLGEAKLDELEEEWGKNRDLYWEQYASLSNRLPKEVFQRFDTYGFHDYLLEKVVINHSNLINTTIQLTVSNEKEKWRLTFTDVFSFSFHHLNKDKPAPILSPEQDLWTREEFLPVNNKIISFEVICHSGANLKIEFKDNGISLEEVL